MMKERRPGAGFPKHLVLPGLWPSFDDDRIDLFCSLRGRLSAELILLAILKPDSRERLCSSQSFAPTITMKLYVGNLSAETTQNDLERLFRQHGQVGEVSLMMDKTTGKSRGFGFVTMTDKADAEAAMTAVSGQDLNGRAVTVSEARASEERPRPYGATRSFHGKRS